MSNYLRVRDIVAFAPILHDRPISDDNLTEPEFMHYAKLWRRTHSMFLFENASAIDARTRELQSAVNGIKIDKRPLSIDEIVALMPLLYENRLSDAETWKLFCEHMQQGIIDFDDGVYFLDKWASLAMPTSLPTCFVALLRLFGELMTPHPLLNDFYVQLSGHKSTRWSSIFSFNDHLANVFKKWRNAEILDNGVRLDPTHKDVISFPVGWTDDLTRMLIKIKT